MLFGKSREEKRRQEELQRQEALKQQQELFKRQQEEERLRQAQEKQQIDRFKNNSFVQKIVQKMLEYMYKDIAAAYRKSSMPVVMVPWYWYVTDEKILIYYRGRQFEKAEEFQDRYNINDIHWPSFREKEWWNFCDNGFTNLDYSQRYYMRQAIEELILERWSLNKDPDIFHNDYDMKITVQNNPNGMEDFSHLDAWGRNFCMEHGSFSAVFMYTAQNGNYVVPKAW